MHSIYGPKIKVLLGGHDRGARMVHRMALSRSELPGLDVIGLFMADIVPIVDQFAVFSNPAASIKYFHWAFLPITNLSVDMIMAYGGGRWCKQILQRSVGSSEKGRANMFADDALEVYARDFEKESVNRAAAEDYRSASNEDYKMQVEDQEKRRQIDLPTLIIFSEKSLGAMHDVPATWKKWFTEGTKYQIEGIGNDVGHYVCEEAPEESAKMLVDFIEELGY